MFNTWLSWDDNHKRWKGGKLGDIEISCWFRSNARWGLSVRSCCIFLFRCPCHCSCTIQAEAVCCRKVKTILLFLFRCPHMRCVLITSLSHVPWALDKLGTHRKQKINLVVYFHVHHNKVRLFWKYDIGYLQTQNIKKRTLDLIRMSSSYFQTQAVCYNVHTFSRSWMDYQVYMLFWGSHVVCLMLLTWTVTFIWSKSSQISHVKK